MDRQSKITRYIATLDVLGFRHTTTVRKTCAANTLAVMLFAESISVAVEVEGRMITKGGLSTTKELCFVDGRLYANSIECTLTNENARRGST